MEKYNQVNQEEMLENAYDYLMICNSIEKNNRKNRFDNKKKHKKYRKS